MRSVRSLVRWRSSLSNRAFSMAMTAWAAKLVTSVDLLIGEGAEPLGGNRENDTDINSVPLEHEGNDQKVLFTSTEFSTGR